MKRDGDRIRLSGALRTSDASVIWTALRGAARSVEPNARIEIDMSEVPAVDGDVMALVVEVRDRLAARGASAELTNMREPVARLAALYTAGGPASPVTARRPENVVARVGAAAFAQAERLQRPLDFFGSLVIAGVGRRRRPRAGHWRQIVALVEATGADAMPIVFAVVFIVGFLFSYATADTFIRMGQRLLSAAIIGRGMSREIAPVMTAFIVSGRSGAAFAAEIGSMKIDHEIDALRTLGLEPFAWLVFPRAVALLVAVPALTIAADLFGFAGGALVGVTKLGLALPVYVHALSRAITPWDIASGIIKSAAFGLVISLVACEQGFAASGGPEEVGRRTRAAVVSGIFFTLVVDAILTITYESFGG